MAAIGESLSLWGNPSSGYSRGLQAKEGWTTATYNIFFVVALRTFAFSYERFSIRERNENCHQLGQLYPGVETEILFLISRNSFSQYNLSNFPCSRKFLLQSTNCFRENYRQKSCTNFFDKITKVSRKYQIFMCSYCTHIFAQKSSERTNKNFLEIMSKLHVLQIF
jgi:hypothetical protein